MKRTEDKRFKNIIQVVKETFSPTKVFLFGSRAKGTHSERSDYDLLVIVEKSDLSHLERMQKIKLALFDARVHEPTDIFIYTQEEFDKRKLDFQSIPETVMHEGKELNIASL